MWVYFFRIVNFYLKKASRKWISVSLFFLMIFQVAAGVLLPFNLKLTSPYILNQRSKAAVPWYNASWLYRRQIVIDRTKVADVAIPSTTYANFPVLISLDALSNINANGTDIRFTSSDGVTELPREIESYSSGSLRAWVKITLTKDSSDSADDTVFMYYGNSGATEPSASSAYGSQNVWKTDGVDVSAAMVQHMKDATASTITDSTSNGINGVKKAASEPIEASGRIGQDQTFDSVDDYIGLANNTALNIADNITLSAWVKGQGSGFSAEKKTVSPFSKNDPLLQVVGSTIYYIWEETIGAVVQLLTATSNLDGTGFTPTQQTTSAFSKRFPQFQVVGSTIYYVWYESDGVNNQIWTATSNLDGTGFTSTKQTTSAFNKQGPQFQVAGSTIYYVWYEFDELANAQIWTATSNLDGTGFTPVKRTISAIDRYRIEFQVAGSTIYYVWYEFDGLYTQIWTATSNLDGTGFTPFEQTTSAFDNSDPQLQVTGSTIYYLWNGFDGSYTQIWTATSNLDGTGFTPVQQTAGGTNKDKPRFQVAGSTIYYVWSQSDGVNNQIWTATSNLDGTGFTPVKQTVTAYIKEHPQLQVVGSKIYYTFEETDDAINDQIWIARTGSNILNKGDSYGLGTSPTGFINAGADSLKYAGAAPSDTKGSAVFSSIDSNWNYLALSYDKTNLKLYVNGSLVSSSAYTSAINTNIFDLIIGNNFNGSIDEVRIYNRILSSQEIITQYNNQNSPSSFYALGSEEYPDRSAAGSGLPSEAYSFPIAPVGGFKISINDNAPQTDTRTVTLKFNAGLDVKRIAVSEDPDFKNASQEEYVPIKTWALSEGEGTKVIYVKFYTVWGQPSKAISRSIVYQKTSAPSFSTVSSFIFPRNLKLGDRGSDVRELQKFLNRKGFIVSLNGPGSPSKETNFFGFATKKNVAKFQKVNNIPSTGYFGPITRKAIFLLGS